MTASASRERVQLHSLIGRALYIAASFFFLSGVAGIGAVIWCSYEDGAFNPGIFYVLIQGVPTFFVSAWAFRHRGRIWATPEGLELGTPTRFIAWSEVAQVEYVPILSALQPFYMIKFRDNRVPVPFYACEDVPRVVARMTPSSAR